MEGDMERRRRKEREEGLKERGRGREAVKERERTEERIFLEKIHVTSRRLLTFLSLHARPFIYSVFQGPGI